jgi:hypothetical protein
MTEEFDIARSSLLSIFLSSPLLDSCNQTSTPPTPLYSDWITCLAEPERKYVISRVLCQGEPTILLFLPMASLSKLPLERGILELVAAYGPC